MRKLFLCLFPCLQLGLMPPAQAADWVSVAHDRLRTVEIDRASVVDSDGGSKVAWGRIVLSDLQADKAGYKSVRALNRYDCRNRSFTIVKRIYLSTDDRPLREEAVDAVVATPVRPGTVDERFFYTVCPQPPAPKAVNLRDVAREAGQRAAEATKSARSRPGSALEPQHRNGLNLVKDTEPAETAPKKPVTVTPPESARPAAPVAAAASPPAAAPPISSYRNLPPPVYSPHPVAPRAPKAPVTAKPVIPAVTPPPPAHNPHAHWSYDGETGPDFWSTLAPENAACRIGTRQSPIDIRDGIKVEQEAIQFDYKPSYFRIVDNGHTIQVNYGPGSRLMVMGRNFELVQFHFHRPAEERIEGRSFDMVAHLVHKDMDGKLAVLSILLENGSANPVVQTLWNNLPLEQNEEYTPKASIQIADLLPARRDYFAYMGSLTTPPCTEGVLWLVLKQPVQISADQIGIFSRFYPQNARPLQSASGRVIKESR